MVKTRPGSGSYGSEHHLLRYMGHHRNRLNERIREAMGTQSGIDWLDFHFAVDNSGSDAEWKGLDFLDDEDLQNAWAEFWPQGRGIQNWDAVGSMEGSGGKEWLLVEAKAHVREIESDCLAIDAESRRKIGDAFETTKRALGVAIERDWLNGYHQYCNRRAVLYFLYQHGVNAHLLFIYFVGDKSGSRRECPRVTTDWDAPLKQQNEHIGFPQNHLLADRIHKLFLPVGESCS